MNPLSQGRKVRINRANNDSEMVGVNRMQPNEIATVLCENRSLRFESKLQYVRISNRLSRPPRIVSR